MDVPISLGVVLVGRDQPGCRPSPAARTPISNSALTLLFFLLVGRVLDHRARGQARATAEQLLALRGADVAVLAADGAAVRRAPEQVAPGDRVLVGMGERIGVDGVVERGALRGRCQPGDRRKPAGPGRCRGLWCSPARSIWVRRWRCARRRPARATLLAECVRLIEAAEARRGRFVVLADRVARALRARRCTPTALATFLGWYFVAGAPAGQALLTASAVLIVTCPCARGARGAGGAGDRDERGCSAPASC